MDSINPTVMKATIESIPILTEENFSSWKIRITSLFKLGKVKDQMYNGTPPLDEEDNTLLTAIILSKISPGTHANIINSTNSEDAQKLWEALTNRFASSEPSNRARVYNQFLSITFESNNIEKFVTEVRSSITKMEDVGIVVPQDLLTYDLLRRLPASLNNIKQAITHSKNGEDITPESLLNHLEIHKNDLKLAASSKAESSTISMLTKEKHYCTPGKHNPLAPHSEEKCWNLHPELRPPYKHQYQKNSGSNVSSLSTFAIKKPSAFVLDSGSSSHMVSDEKLFIALDKTERGMINTSCGDNTLSIEGKGSISVVFRGNSIVFHNVLLVPKINANLLSLRHLLLQNYEVNFEINKFSVLQHGQLILEGNYQNNLPVIELHPCHQQSHFSSSEIIHKSLGHISYGRIRQKLGIPIKAEKTCQSCALAKITKASYKHRTSRASRPLEEIHLDLIGPIKPMSYKKHQYILTIVDSATRYCSAVPIPAKSEVFEVLSALLDIEAKRLGYYPSIIHSDQGTEFTNSQLEDYCKKHVIRLRFSDPHTPQQNGLAERFNRTILESLRTVLLDSKFPKHLWSEVLGACVLTINQVPSHRSNKSPYKLFKQVSLPISFFRPIGNPVVVYSHKAKGKLEPRGQPGKLIGFDAELKSYKILTEDGNIINSKNVTFLDFPSNVHSDSDWDDLLTEEKPPQVESIQAPKEDHISIKEEDEDDSIDSLQETNNNGISETDDASSSEGENLEVAEELVPAPIASSVRVLRERTSRVKPDKYSYLTVDPTSFKKAISGENSSEWKKAINEELDNIESHDVWSDHFSTPPKALRSTWVFRTKPATQSTPEKQKARLCIQGFMQTAGEDFFETFAPTGKFPSLLTLLVLAIDLNLPIKQFDVKSAFLFAPLDEEIYIRTPEGSHRKAPYLKLKKSLYGLKQSPLNWYNTLTSWFEEIDYLPSMSDACLYIHKNKDSFIFFHVDDMIVVGNVNQFEASFLRRFPNSTAHPPDTLLGMDLDISKDCVKLSQTSLIEKGLELLHLQGSSPVKTPLSPAVQLHSATDEEHRAFLKLNINYRSFTGILNYLACRTRPDLAAAVSILSRFNHKPGLTHWNQVIHCWKYLIGTKHLKLCLKPNPLDSSHRINFYTDATWADDQETRISQSGSLAFWKSCPILWNSKKQRNITMSSTEAEMNALSDGKQESQWLMFLVEELWKNQLKPTLFHIDNKGLLEKLKNFGSNSKTKHLDIKIKSLRNKFKNNEIDVKLVSSEDMIADSLTKAAPHSSVEKLQSQCFAIQKPSSKEGC